MATKKPAAKLKNSNKLFKKFLKKHCADIADGFIEITANERIYSSDMCVKKIEVRVYRDVKNIPLGKEKGWQILVVRELSECGFIYKQTVKSNWGCYQLDLVCGISF